MTQNNAGIEDSDDTGTLVIDEGKAPNVCIFIYPSINFK